MAPTSREEDLRSKMIWARWAAGIVLAVVFSVVATMYWQHDSLVEGCMRNGMRATIAAAGWNDVAVARSDRGEAEAAARSRAIAAMTIDNIPAPSGLKDRSLLARVVMVEKPEPHYVISSQSLRLQRAGCTEAFPRPISFIM